MEIVYCGLRTVSLSCFLWASKLPGLLWCQCSCWAGVALLAITSPSLVSQVTRPSCTSTTLTVEKELFPAVPEGPGAWLLLLPKARSKFVCQGSEEEGWEWGRRGPWQNFEF